MNWEQLIQVFTLINEPYSSAYVAAQPTAESIQRIGQALKITLPEKLLRFARDCPSYGTWFASIGPDYDSYLHILELNNEFRREGEFGNNGKVLSPLPPDLIMINHGHDGDCDCLEIGSFHEQTAEYRISYWSQTNARPTLSWATFHEYLEWHVGNWTRSASPEIQTRIDRILHA